jgi:hypothetical protein
MTKRKIRDIDSIMFKNPTIAQLDEVIEFTRGEIEKLQALKYKCQVMLLELRTKK